MRRRTFAAALCVGFAVVRSVAAAEASPPEIPSPVRLREIVGELRSALRGADVTLNASESELEGAFYALRRAVALRGVERARNGTLVRVLRDDSGAEALPELILLSGVAVKNGEEWIGFIYPTGMRAAVTGTGGVPVFSDGAERSARLVLQFLELRSGVAQGTSAAAEPQSGSVQGIDSKGGYTGPAGNYGIQGFYWNIGWPGPWRFHPHPVHPPKPPPPPPPQPPQPRTAGFQTAP